jgi:pyrimidine operon attenuation protein/uracil phosphoribosyltransferase
MKIKATVVDAKSFDRTVARLAHEILERNKGAENLGLIGIRTRGDHLARRLVDKIFEIEKKKVDVGFLDITLYRDDLRHRLTQPVLQATEIHFDVNGKDVVLVDDVLYTGRTIRAALDSLIDLGRPATIQLAVMVDRGHRELPIKADFVGKNIPTAVGEQVKVLMKEVDGEDSIVIIESED